MQLTGIARFRIEEELKVVTPYRQCRINFAAFAVAQDMASRIEHEIREAAEHVLELCRRKKLKIVTAESCTGGLIAAALTAIAGSSDVVDRAFVTYSNEAKREMIGVPWDAILGHGAVSEPVARAMAAGALARSNADIAVSVTGVAGPGGGTEQKPVGTVVVAVVTEGHADVRTFLFPGSREQVKYQSTQGALNMLRLMMTRV